jgi:hypothetical protein
MYLPFLMLVLVPAAKGTMDNMRVVIQLRQMDPVAYHDLQKSHYRQKAVSSDS